MALHSGKKPGTVRTRPFTWRGETLFLNMDGSNGGALEVEVLSASGVVVAVPKKVTRDRPRHQVESVKGDALLLRNRVVSLSFTLREAHLYSYWFE